ncbi:MAG TPA: extracellular solute-binding protein [Dictyobacter sp.]|jgi:arabinosaccharide transport system substrate-binding protein|nr:extracellular solute-binding protein [Dictyobacter sp.]
MNRMDRRTFVKVAGGMVAGSLLFGGCGEAPAFNRGVKKTLNFWAFSDTRTAWQKKAFELYKKARNPDFEINWLIMPYNQMHDQILITSQAGSGGPDIADIEISQFARFIKGDVIFVDMAPKLQAMNLMDQFYRPSATDPWSWQGHVYGIGNELNTVLLSYQWDIWEKARVKTPINSWDDFAEEAKRFHSDTGKYLIDVPFDAWGDWWILALQQRSGFFNAQGQPVLNDPINVRTLAFQKQALKDGWATTRPPSQSQASYMAALSSGNVTSLIGPSWQFSGFVQQNISQTKGQWHLQPLPAWTPGGSRTATQGGTGVSVMKTSSSAEEALDFVLYEHSTPEALLNDFTLRQTWPTFRPAFADARLSEPLAFFDNQRVGTLIQELSPEINQWYNSPYWPETTSACIAYGITPAIQNAAVSAQQALDNAQKQTMDTINFETA